MDEMRQVTKNIRNHFRINDWVQLANGGERAANLTYRL